MSELQVGVVVDVTKVGRGVVRFIGNTEFSSGKWVGIELQKPNGKNNGTVQGIQYFSCPSNCGVFVRPSQATVVPMPPPVEVRQPTQVPSTPVRPTASAPGGTVTPSTITRPSMTHARTLSTDRARRPSLRGVASPSPAASRAESPSKPAGPGNIAPRLLAASNARTRPANPPSPTKRLTLAPAAPVSSKVSITRPRVSTNESAPPTSATSRSRPSEPIRGESLLSVSPSPSQRSSSQRTSSPSSPPIPSTPIINLPSISTSLDEAASQASAAQAKKLAEVEQEAQELRARVKVMDAKRIDDGREIEKLEAQLTEVNHFVAMRPKLQQKIATLQQELTENRRSLADSEQSQAEHDNRLQELQEQLEMSMLDKEVAEERAEAAEQDLQALQERQENLELELETLKEGGARIGEGDDAVKTSLAYTQLEKHNDRLKEALIKLRDASRETQEEQRHRMVELERELQDVEELHSQYDATLGRLANAEAQIDELKEQLDDALGAEEMLEQLTERNLMLGEKIAEMTITIEDLESLKELNDELEENHMETEKQLQEEIEQKDAQNREQTRKISELEDVCLDLEGTINQFRELVMQLQTELDMLRMETQNAHNESATAASQTATLMSHNLKLQSTASKNQARAIEVELTKIEARENKELYEIVKPYLPQIYVESDRDATYCYLFFQRMSSKADLINFAVAQLHGLPEALNGKVDETLVRTCELRSRVTTMSVLCKRIASIIRRGDVDSFLNFGRMYPDLAHLEKRIDMHIDLLCRGEFRDEECVGDAMKMASQIEHLANAYATGYDYDLGERELGIAQNFDRDLDNIAAPVALINSRLLELLDDEDVTVESEDDAVTEIIEPFKQLLDQIKGTKSISRKLTKRLEDLVQDSAALKTQFISALDSLNSKTTALVNFAIQLAQAILPRVDGIRNDKGVLRCRTVIDFVRKSAVATLNSERKDGASWDIVSEAISKLTDEVAALVPLANEQENIVRITSVPPWVVRIEEVKNALAVNVEAERKVAQLNEEIQGLARGIRSRDQTIQESNVKIELMERRMDMVKKQADAITSLESEIAKARKQERSYEEAIEQLQSDLDTLERDNETLKKLAAIAERQPSVGPQVAESENVTTVEGSLETSHLLEQIEALRGAVRYLRRENSYLKGQDLLKEIQALPTLPDFSSRGPTPPLDPSGSSSESESDSDEQRPPSLRSLATETSLLYRDVIQFSSTPKIVDLTAMNRKRMESSQNIRGWMPKRMTPSYQLLERKLAAERLSRRVRGLLERASSLGMTR